MIRKNIITIYIVIVTTLSEIALLGNACTLISALNSNMTVLEYKVLSMTCEFYCSENGVYNGCWTRGNINIIDQSGVIMTTNSTKTTKGTVIRTYLNISSIKRTDEGEYRCLLIDVYSDLNVESSAGCVVSVQEIPSPDFPIITVLNLDYNTTQATCVTQKTSPPAKLYWLDQLVPMQVVHNKTHISIKVVFRAKLYAELGCIMYVVGEKVPRVRKIILRKGSLNRLDSNKRDHPLPPTEEVYLTSAKEIEVSHFDDHLSPNSFNRSVFTSTLITTTVTFLLVFILFIVISYKLRKYTNTNDLPHTSTNEKLLHHESVACTQMDIKK